jgi:hypothetical protein
MQIRWRKNPKTEEGWFKRIAISLLVAVAAFAVSFPLAFVLLLHYLHQSSPTNNETFLNAMTSAVALGLVIAALSFFASITILWLLSLRSKPQ